MPNMKKIDFFYYTHTMINVISFFLDKNFKEKNVMQWLKSSFEPKGPGFNPFCNYFC